MQNEVGGKLLHAFDSSKSGLPYTDINFATLKPSRSAWAKHVGLADVGTLQLEFNDLAFHRNRVDIAVSLPFSLSRFL